MLRASQWTASLSETELERVEAGVFERQIGAGKSVCRKGESCDHWFGIIEGLVKMSSDRVTGKTATLTGIPSGGWFGEGSMLKSEPRRYDVIALRDSRVACMRRETFLWLLDHSLAFNRFVLVQLNERLGLFIGMLETERLHDPDTRVAHCLTSLFHPVLYPNLGDRLAISQEEVGYLAGISRQRVNRSLKVLEDAGFLRVEYGGVTILDLEGLRRFGS
ncbi:MAG: Crp/Fnr family transcriptional regulator [Betaproteobacteria bacterium]|nr:Crp/Fnr family transcriptional regulator [Betaproteobacteria bacterium]